MRSVGSCHCGLRAELGHPGCFNMFSTHPCWKTWPWDELAVTLCITGWSCRCFQDQTTGFHRNSNEKLVQRLHEKTAIQVFDPALVFIQRNSYSFVHVCSCHFYPTKPMFQYVSRFFFMFLGGKTALRPPRLLFRRARSNPWHLTTRDGRIVIGPQPSSWCHRCFRKKWCFSIGKNMENVEKYLFFLEKGRRKHFNDPFYVYFCWVFCGFSVGFSSRRSWMLCHLIHSYPMSCCLVVSHGRNIYKCWK